MAQNTSKIRNPNRVEAKRYANGRLNFKTPYKNGKRHGLSIGWEESGEKSWEINWRQGKIHGLETGWRENGEKWELTWKDGKQHGFVTYWKGNGRIKGEVYRTQDKECTLEWDDEAIVTKANFPIRSNPTSNINKTFFLNQELIHI